MILFVIVRRNQMILASRSIEMYEKVMNIFDAVGLGAFTVVGIDTAVLAGYGRYHFLIIFLGVITGVGGGLLRDIMAGETPYILRKHVYASASITGAVLYAYLQDYMNNDAAMLIGAGSVIPDPGSGHPLLLEFADGHEKITATTIYRRTYYENTDPLRRRHHLLTLPDGYALNHFGGGGRLLDTRLF